MMTPLLPILVAAVSQVAATPVVERVERVGTPAAPALFERVAVFGASLSAGTGLDDELKAKVRLGDVFACMIEVETEVVADLGDMWFFMNPRDTGRAMAARAQETEPTLVVALDFLFWYAYGSMSHDSRLTGLERGLEQLAAFECPLVIGDFPDVTVALQGEGPFGQPLVTPDMIPNAESLAAVNARVREWAESRGDVVVVPIAGFLKRVVDGEPINVRGNAWPENSVRTLLQKDLLHPTVDGTLGVLLLALDALIAQRDDVTEEHVVLEVESARARLMQRTAKARARVEERERRKAERAKRKAEREKARR